MKLLIAGSRNMDVRQEVRKFVASLPASTILINGGAAGVDTFAADAAQAYGLTVQVYKPDWRKFGKSAGMIRNSEMVDAAECVVCWWDGVSRGTQNTIAKAAKAGKLLKVFGRGEWLDWESL